MINRKIDPDIEKNIVKELKTEKDLIKAKEVPIKYYNYSYIKDLLEQKYNQKVSLPTIIDRANGILLHHLMINSGVILYAVLVKYGFPLAYYVDSHSIFRFAH